MNWHQYLSCFFAGLFLANAVPHYVYGVCGNRFPTPFAKPPGKGLSSPMVNVVWALANLVAGYVLFRVGRVSTGDDVGVVLFFVGIALISVMLSANFAKKETK